MKYNRFLSLLVSVVSMTVITGCSTTMPIEAWREKYPGEDVYAVSETHNPDSINEEEIRELALKQVADLANRQGRQFEILEETKSLDTIKIPERSEAETLLTLRIIFRLLDSHQ